ncbi:MAG: cytochrome c [Gallionella sp.]
MNKIVMLILLSLSMACIAEESGVTDLTAHDIFDNRASLDLSPRIKHRLLSNMRGQMMATRSIIALLADERFEKAANIARTKLGMPEDLKKIYAASNNEEFKKLGFAAHTSADELANILKTKDLKKSLRALSKTISYCVQCHQKFRQ